MGKEEKKKMEQKDGYQEMLRLKKHTEQQQQNILQKQK